MVHVITKKTKVTKCYQKHIVFDTSSFLGLISLTSLLDILLTKLVPMFSSGRGLCPVEWAVGQTLWRRVSFTDDHQVYPRQLLPGQSSGQWLSSRELSVAGHWWYVWAARCISRAIQRRNSLNKINRFKNFILGKERTLWNCWYFMHCLKKAAS